MAQHEIIITANFVKAASMFAGTDQSRPILTGIHFAHEGGKLVIVATDSYRLIVCDTGTIVEEFEPFTLPAKALVGMKPKKSSIFGGDAGYVIRFDGDGNTASVTTDFEQFTTIRVLEGKYPNYRQLLPIGGEQFTVEPTIVNAAFMADACKAFTTIEKAARLCVATRTSKPNVLECKGEGWTATAIVMPCRGDGRELAKWQAAPQGDAETAKKLTDAAARIAELERDYELAQKHYMEAVESVKQLEDDKQYWMEKAERYEDVGETYYLKYEKLLQEHEELAGAHADGARHEWESPTCYWYDHEVEGARLCKKGKNKGNWWIKKTA